MKKMLHNMYRRKSRGFRTSTLFPFDNRRHSANFSHMSTLPPTASPGTGRYGTGRYGTGRYGTLCNLGCTLRHTLSFFNKGYIASIIKAMYTRVNPLITTVKDRDAH